MTQKQTLRVYNIAREGFAFALNEETGDTVFLSRQLCVGMEVTEEDVGRFINAVVSDGAKGPQALTFDWVDEVQEDVVEKLEARVDKLEQTVADLIRLM